MYQNPEIPHNDLPLLPPGTDIETKIILRKAITANKALAELKGLDRILPSNSTVLINTLPLQEACTSSEIENIMTTHDELFRSFVSSSGATDPATKEVLRYRQALWDGYRLMKADGSLNSQVFIRIANDINGNDAGIRKQPGTQIRKGNGALVYTPPQGEEVIREKLNNLEDYIHNDDGVDPLIKLAVIHYQFEAIHPFYNGNGRTGRIINTLYLVSNDLLDLPILYFSKYIIENKAEYYHLIRRVTEKQEWEPWILYMLDAIEKTSRYTILLAKQIHKSLDDTLHLARHLLPSRVYSKELIEQLYIQPYTKVRHIVDSGIAKRQTAAEYLDECVKAGILKKEQRGKENLYLNIALFDVLTNKPAQ